MCEICLLEEQLSKLNGTDASGLQSGHIPTSSRTNRLSRMLSSIRSAFASIAQFVRDTKPSIPSFPPVAPLFHSLDYGYTNTQNLMLSNSYIIDTTNPNFTPVTARRYIDLFCKHTRPGTKAFSLDGRSIFYFDIMSDEEAVLIASALLQFETLEAIYQIRRNV